MKIRLCGITGKGVLTNLGIDLGDVADKGGGQKHNHRQMCNDSSYDVIGTHARLSLHIFRVFLAMIATGTQ